MFSELFTAFSTAFFCIWGLALVCTAEVVVDMGYFVSKPFISFYISSYISYLPLFCRPSGGHWQREPFGGFDQSCVSIECEVSQFVSGVLNMEHIVISRTNRTEDFWVIIQSMHVREDLIQDLHTMCWALLTICLRLYPDFRCMSAVSLSLPSG